MNAERGRTDSGFCSRTHREERKTGAKEARNKVFPSFRHVAPACCADKTNTPYPTNQPTPRAVGKGHSAKPQPRSSGIRRLTKSPPHVSRCGERLGALRTGTYRYRIIAELVTFGRSQATKRCRMKKQRQAATRKSLHSFRRRRLCT